MEVLELDPISYDKLFPFPSHIFNSARFNELNKLKCEKIYYIAFKNSKIRMGIIFGMKGYNLLSPFSAPFGGFEAVNNDISLQQIDSSLLVLENWAKEKKIENIKITLPPFIYFPIFLNKVYNSLFRREYRIANIELNYQFPTEKLTENYLYTISYNARKNLKKSFQYELFFEKIESKYGQIAYDIIAQNRKERGFSLRMTWAQVQETMRIIDVDFFIVKKEQVSIGAALVFHVSTDVVQVVYWGDLPKYSEYKTMNFLSYNIFKYYKENGIKIVDIGPSTENSIPNHGLCEFKESIGCDISIKTEFYKKIN